MANLWSGRFEKGMDKIVEEFNASIFFDKRLYECDIEGSIAHVTMLCEQGIVTADEKNKIIAELKNIKEEIKKGVIEFSVHDEDIHMAVEGILIRRLGDTGKKLHTARSRNDQVAVDTRLYVKKEIKNILEVLNYLENVILDKSEKYYDKIMVGFTHMQHAQPVTVGFHLMAYFQMFKRDMERFIQCFDRTDYNPLGSCALAGTTIPIDRYRTTELLGFKNVTENAMDSVSDRDYILELMSAGSICMMHISRMAEEFVYWNSQEFSYISIDDGFCTGSSIMPQKKNPDMAELLRGKVGRIYGRLVQLLTVMKATPLAYNKDFQEDKEGLFDTVDTLKNSILILAKMLERTEFIIENIQKHLNSGFLNATDIAENFVKINIPFREAHELVGKMVKYSENNHKQLEELTDDDLQKIDKRLNKAMLPDLSMEGCVKGRVSYGGTAPSEVQRQINKGREWIENLKY